MGSKKIRTKTVEEKEAQRGLIKSYKPGDQEFIGVALEDRPSQEAVEGLGMSLRGSAPKSADPILP